MKNRKCFSIIGLLALFIATLIPTAFAKWDFVGNPVSTSITPTTTNVCYIKGDSTNYYFPTIESAVAAANTMDKAQEIYVTPTTNTIYIRDNIILDGGDVLILPYENTTYKSTKNNFSSASQSTFEQIATKKVTTVILESGYNITLNGGALVIGGWVGHGSSAGLISCTASSHCELIVKDGSHIYIDKESENSNFKALECYGYIRRQTLTSGKSGIIAKAGTILTPFVIYDAKGGNNTSSLIGSKIFPFYTFDFPNLEIDLEIHHGASLLGIFRIKMSLGSVDTTVNLVGSSTSIFLTSESAHVFISYIPPKYKTPSIDPITTQGNTTIDLYGDCKISPITISVPLSTIHSQEFYLPISYKFAINCFPGSSGTSTLTLNNDLLLLPGAQVIVGEGVNFVCSSNLFIHSKMTDHNNKIEADTANKTNRYPFNTFDNGATFICNGTFKVSAGKSVGGFIDTESSKSSLDFTNANFNSNYGVSHCIGFASSGNYGTMTLIEGFPYGYINSTTATTNFGSNTYQGHYDELDKKFYWYYEEKENEIGSVSITSSPTSLGSSGGELKLTAEVKDIKPAGTNVSYKWYQSTDGETYTEISGATGNTCTRDIGNNSSTSEKTHYFKVEVTHTIDTKVKVEAYASINQSGTNICLTSETKVLLSSGKYKFIKDLTRDDELIVYDHYNGKFVKSNVFFFSTKEKSLQNIITLHFENGNKLDVVQGHALYNVSQNRYVTYHNKEEFIADIGEEFLSVDSNYPQNLVKTKLLYVTTSYKEVEIMTPVSKYYLNVIAEGMLTMPDDMEGILDFFNFNEDFSYNQDYINEQVEKYGIYTYEDVKDVMPEELYYGFNFALVKPMIKSGYITYDTINYYLDKFINHIVEYNELDWDTSKRVPLGPQHG